MVFFQGTQEEVLVRQGKLVIRDRAIEVVLYYHYFFIIIVVIVAVAVYRLLHYVRAAKIQHFLRTYHVVAK